MSTLGERLRKARERKNLSQTEAAKRLNINNKTLSRYENGGSEPDLETLKSLAELYEESPNYLTGYAERVKEGKNKYEVLSKEELIRTEKLKLAEMIMGLPDQERNLIEEMIKTLQKKRE